MAKEAAPSDTKARRPRFARRFPRDAALDALVDAFDEGNYAKVRREAPELAEKTSNDDVKVAALELRRRIDPDPLSIALMVLACTLLVVLAIFYFTHKHVG